MTFFRSSANDRSRNKHGTDWFLSSVFRCHLFDCDGVQLYACGRLRATRRFTRVRRWVARQIGLPVTEFDRVLVDDGAILVNDQVTLSRFERVINVRVVRKKRTRIFRSNLHSKLPLHHSPTIDSCQEDGQILPHYEIGLREPSKESSDIANGIPGQSFLSRDSIQHARNNDSRRRMVVTCRVFIVARRCGGCAVSLPRKYTEHRSSACIRSCYRTCSSSSACPVDVSGPI
jgi:hypothetical protein